MRSSLDCIPCFVRQALDAARAVSDDPGFHDDVVRETLQWMAEADLSQSPPSFAQHIHRRLRTITADDDPYRAAKDRQNQMALRLLPGLRAVVDGADDPLETAVRLAVAGNAIDMGVKTEVTEADLGRAIEQALEEPLAGDYMGFRRAVESAGSILYLADNAGEIALDQLLIEQLGPRPVTVAVRGIPVLNDATLLSDCSEQFRRRFAEADLVIAKGQGNYESLSDEPRDIFFLSR